VYHKRIDRVVITELGAGWRIEKGVCPKEKQQMYLVLDYYIDIDNADPEPLKEQLAVALQEWADEHSVRVVLGTIEAVPGVEVEDED